MENLRPAADVPLINTSPSSPPGGADMVRTIAAALAALYMLTFLFPARPPVATQPRPGVHTVAMI
jgi:hypothetical protein